MPKPVIFARNKPIPTGFPDLRDSILFLALAVAKLSEYRKSTIQTMYYLENWKKNFDNISKIVATVFMDLSKAFDCIPYDLLIAKMEAYVSSENFLMTEVLKKITIHEHKECAHIMFQILLSGLP